MPGHQPELSQHSKPNHATELAAKPSLVPLVLLALATLFSELISLCATMILVPERWNDPPPSTAANVLLAICWTVTGLLLLALIPLAVLTVIRRFRLW
jgi:hypothetical protein